MRVSQERSSDLVPPKELAPHPLVSVESVRRSHRLRDVAVIGFGLTLAVLLIGGALGYVNLQLLAANERQVDQSNETIGELEGLLSLLKDAETGQRGYLLTENEVYLQPFEDALGMIQDGLGRLKRLTADSADQKARLAVLEAKIASRIDESKRTIALMKAGDRKAAMNIIHSNTGKAMMDDLRQRVSEMRRTEEGVLRRRAADSQSRLVTTIVSILFSTLIGVVLVCVVFYLSQRNVTMRQRAAEAIAAQRELLRVTLASIGDAVVTTDRQGRVTYMNAVAESLTGWKMDEASGQPLESVFRIVNDETRQPVENPAKRALAEGVIVGLANHTVLVRRDGAELPIDDSAAPIIDEHGEAAGSVLIFRDITERRRLEKENAERLRAARLLASIVESSGDAVVSKTHTGIIETWNAAAEKLFGYSALEAVGQHISLIIPPDRMSEEEEILRRIRAGERVDHLETVRIRANGQTVHVSLTVSPILDESGRVVGASKIARDISDRKQAEERIYGLLTELKEADRRKDEFLATLAHELRGPLAPLRNNLEIMKRADGDGELLQQARGTMERQLGHLVRLVDDLIDVSRITRGKLQLRKERVELNAILRESVEACQPLAESLKHTLTLSVPPEPIHVFADPVRLAQVFNNILNNACKYTDTGGSVRLVAQRESNDAVVRIADTGMGIPPEKLSKVFEMFTQIERTLDRSQGGLGIGLTLVKRLVEMHEGTVYAHSEGLLRGSEFVVRLPALSDSPVTEDTTPSAEPASPARRVLVVDDNKDAASSLTLLLRMAGNETHVAHEGLAAVDEAEKLRPEVVLLDIGLPKLNGFDACRRIRQTEWGKKMTIIALTGWGQEEDRRRSREAGFDYHIVKPVDFSALIKLLAEKPPNAV